MATLVKSPEFSLRLGQGKFNFASDTLKIALTNTTPAGTEKQLSDLTQISLTNLTVPNVVTTSWTATAGLSKLVLADHVITATGAAAAFRYVWVYDDTAAADDIVGYYDIGVAITLDGTTLTTYTSDFDQSAGALTI